MSSVRTMVDVLAKEAARPNARDNQVHRMFLPSERYRIDFADDFKSEGWEQYDTDQDAAYFGVWVNRRTFQTLTYCEGDWTLVVCPDAAHYNAEIEDANRFYGEGFIAKAIDTTNGAVTVYQQDRARFLVA